MACNYECLCVDDEVMRLRMTIYHFLDFSSLPSFFAVWSFLRAVLIYSRCVGENRLDPNTLPSSNHSVETQILGVTEILNA